MVNNISKIFIDHSLLLLVQFRTGFGQSGSFSNCVIVTGQSRKWSKLCSPIVHRHSQTIRENVVRPTMSRRKNNIINTTILKA